MWREPVASTSIASIGYDAGTQTLEVEFEGGAVYQYHNVPKVVYEALQVADSKGGFVNGVIKRYFSYTRV